MSDLTPLDREARDILTVNDRGSYTVPTDGLYPYQWNWDSAFAAYGFSTFDIPRAWAELDTLMTGQWDDGMVPHILFHQVDPGYFPGPDVWGCDGPVPSSGISQPPVAATFARKVFEADPDQGRARIAALFPKLKAWHRWFITWRSDDQGAICISHPWEAGRDNAPDWDGAMAAIDPEGVQPYTRRDTSHVDPHMRPTKYDYDRYIWLVEQGRSVGWDQKILKDINPFRIADPTMTFTLLRANRDLLAMGQALGEDVSEIQDWITRLEAGAASLWNDELASYDARDVRSGAWSGCVSNASFLCWYGGVNDDRMLAQFDRVMGAVTYGMPSHDPASAKFDSRRYWRGPTWAIMNTLIGMGLQDAGQTTRGEILRERTQAAIATNGFAEYFDPLDGTPAGGGTFTWTAAVWLAWVRTTQKGSV